MSDMGHDWTDEQIAELSRRFEKEYAKAADEMAKKLKSALADYERENSQRLKALDGTEESKRLYEEWKRSQLISQRWLEDMAHQLSESAANANMHAADMINDCLPRVYSENSNMAAFALEKRLGYDVGFTLVNEDAIRHLMGMPAMKAGDDQLLREVTDTPEEARKHVQDLRKRQMDYPKDMRWNRERFHSAITQGILQGESIPNIVKRTKDIYGRNKAAAVRAARTATTNAENAGRMNTFERAQKLGIDMEIEWLATPDGRTRSAHRELDGKRIQLGESFVNSIGSIRWPGDPQAAGANIWNCRCRANGRVVGFDGKRGDWADERGERWTRLTKGMTYDEWKKAKAVSREESYKNPSNILSGFWNDADKQTSDNVEAWPTSIVEDIGTEPIRPRRGDFDSRDEYLAARDEYRTARDEFEERKQKLIDEIVSRPDHGYTSDEAIREWAKANGVVVSDSAMSDVDRRVLDEAISALDELLSKYPQVNGWYGKYGKSFTIGTDAYSGEFMEASGGLNISTRYNSSYRSSVQTIVDGYTTQTYNEQLGRNLRFQVRGDGTLGTTVTHEFGHNLEHAISEKFVTHDQYGDVTFTDDWDKYTKELREITAKHTTSEYSLTNHDEAFAEGFAEYERNPESDYAKAFGEFLRRWL